MLTRTVDLHGDQFSWVLYCARFGPSADGGPPLATLHMPIAGLTLRPATPADNPALVELARICPMPAPISLAFERTPDFFALCRARGESRTLVAEVAGEVVACASVGRRRAYVNGSPSEIGYVADLKVAPRFRGRYLPHLLIARLAADEASLSPAAYVMTFAAGNRTIDALLHRTLKHRPIERLGTITSFQLFPLVRLGVSARFEIRRAGPGDEAALSGLLDSFHRQYELAPVFATGGLREVLERSLGMELSSYFVASQGGRLLAALGLWDQDGFKQTRVHRMPPGLRWFTRSVRAASRFLPLPALPLEGEVLRLVHVRHPCHLPGQQQALAALTRFTVNWCREQGRHLALFTCAAGDALEECARGIPRAVYRYHVAVVRNGPGREPDFDGLTRRRIFDDAALA